MSSEGRNIVYIGPEKHIVTQAVENRLPEAGLNVISLLPDIDKINRQRDSADIFLCYADYSSPKTEAVMHYLSALCSDEHRSMCLIVDNAAAREQVMKMKSAQRAPQTSEIPIIFLTGVDDRDSVMRVVNLKPDGYLLKSMRKSELLDALNRFLVRNILDGGMSQK